MGFNSGFKGLTSSKSHDGLRKMTYYLKYITELTPFLFSGPELMRGFLIVMETTVRELRILCKARAEVEETVEHPRVLY